MSNHKTANSQSCIAVVRTPLQLINASEYIYEHGMRGATLIVIRNCRKWDFSVFEEVPSINLWSRVVEFEWSCNRFNQKQDHSPLKIFGDLIDDFRFKRFFSMERKEWPDFGTLIIGNTNDLWLRHIANSFKGWGALVECEDGAASLNKNWLPTKSWLLRKIICGFHAEEPRLNETFSSYERVVSSGVNVKNNNYRYIATLFDQGKLQVGEDVWFVGQPLVELGLMSRQAYLGAISAVKANYSGNVRVLYCPHPSEREDNIDYLCLFLGLDLICQRSILEISILTAEKVPSRIASFYSSSISTVLGIFNNIVCVDVYRPDANLFTNKMTNETYKNIYDWFEEKINIPNRFYRISNGDYSIY